MQNFEIILINLYDRVILRRPLVTLVILLSVVLFFGYHAKDFRLDASTETLLLENDKDLLYSREIDARYKKQDFLLVAYTQHDDLFSDKTLSSLTLLQDEIKKLDMVSSVVSLLDAPLLENSPVSIKELAGNIRTLASPDVDKNLAKSEIRKSPLYQNLLVSPDLKTAALQINLKPDLMYDKLMARLGYLRMKKAGNELTKEERIEYRNVSAQFQSHRDKIKKQRHENIKALRSVIDRHRSDAKIFLGGVGMVADDLITFVKNDLLVFGIGVFIVLIITLGLIFKRIRWVLLSMCCCAFSVITMIGILGMTDWEVTVISSNFVSLQLILTMSLTIHITVRYLEILSDHSEMNQKQLVLNTVNTIITPSVYCNLTTMAGFGSLVLCNIRPVITFGWMMFMGLIVSFLMTFLFYPVVLILLNKIMPRLGKQFGHTLTSTAAALATFHRPAILTISAIAMVFSIIGISMLEVENSFINYFKKSTEIYQGMSIIDQKLGGTTPFDVIIHMGDTEKSTSDVVSKNSSNNADSFDEFDEFETMKSEDKYWFTSDKMDQIKKIHNYLESIPEIGKVVSLGTMMEIAETFNQGKPLDNFQLALLYSELPENFKEIALTPYVSIKNNEARFSIRVKDSEETLKRDNLLKQIRYDLTHRLGLTETNIHLAGMLVLYNNMLQSLFHSQIRTIGFTLLALTIMFFILFRSLKIAIIATCPSVLSIGLVLGLMGWLHMPLDVMTITIASISVGIAVDDTIHYIHRFKKEFMVDQDYVKCLHRCHGSIGYAMYYTSIAIIIGFSILALSNFIPSISFGLLIGLAMIIALGGALILLPTLIILIKPFGRELEIALD